MNDFCTPCNTPRRRKQGMMPAAPRMRRVRASNAARLRTARHCMQGKNAKNAAFRAKNVAYDVFCKVMKHFLHPHYIIGHNFAARK